MFSVPAFKIKILSSSSRFGLKRAYQEKFSLVKPFDAAGKGRNLVLESYTEIAQESQ